MLGGYSAPGVYKREIDVSDILVPDGISTGGVVVRSRKGPINRPVYVKNNQEYLDYFGQPYFVSGTSINKQIPEQGYGSYASLEFLKESNSLYVVRAVGDEDTYSWTAIDTSGCETSESLSSATTGIGCSMIDYNHFDTVEYISSLEDGLDETVPVSVGFISPGADGNDYAVSVEVLTPFADWLYKYDDEDATRPTTGSFYVVKFHDELVASTPPTNEEILKHAIFVPVFWNNSTNVKRFFPIASKIVKLSVYKKTTDSWDNMFVNTDDKNYNKIRGLQPVEVFYGTTVRYDGDLSSMYLEDVVNGSSKFIYIKCSGTEFDISEAFNNSNLTGGQGSTVDTFSVNVPYSTDSKGTFVRKGTSANGFGLVSLKHGVTDFSKDDASDSSYYDVFKNMEELSVQILIGTSTDTTVKQKIGEICAYRKDCIASLPVGELSDYDYKDVYASEEYGYVSPSYVALYAGYSKIYDTYNKKSVYIPNSIYGASVMARTDKVSAPWFAPAGLNRATLAVADQNKIFSNDQIGELYDRNINAIKRTPSGFAIWGQKTAQRKTSALDRINVRRTLIYIQENIEKKLNDFLFENNTVSTRIRVYSVIEEFLKSILVAEGLTDYKIVCDETNNTPYVIDMNQLNVDIYVAPVKSIEFIQFTTIVTRTGVSFSDVQLKYA